MCQRGERHRGLQVDDRKNRSDNRYDNGWDSRERDVPDELERHQAAMEASNRSERFTGLSSWFDGNRQVVDVVGRVSFPDNGGSDGKMECIGR